MKRIQVAFASGQRFNPGKIFPTDDGEDASSQRAVRRSLGPDAYV